MDTLDQTMGRREAVRRLGRIGLLAAAAGGLFAGSRDAEARKTEPTPVPGRTPVAEPTIPRPDWENMAPFTLMMWQSGDGYHILRGINFSNGQVQIEVCDKSGGCAGSLWEGSHILQGPDFWQTTKLRTKTATRTQLEYSGQVTAIDLTTGNRSNTLSFTSYREP